MRKPRLLQRHGNKGGGGFNTFFEDTAPGVTISPDGLTLTKTNTAWRSGIANVGRNIADGGRFQHELLHVAMLRTGTGDDVEGGFCFQPEYNHGSFYDPTFQTAFVILGSYQAAPRLITVGTNISGGNFGVPGVDPEWANTTGVGDIFGIFLDFDNDKFEMTRNGYLQNVAFGFKPSDFVANNPTTDGIFWPSSAMYSVTSSGTWNFGATPFAFPRAGFTPWNG